MADKKIIDLERLQQFLSKCDARYIRYGKKVYDGTLGAGTSDLADNLIATKGLTVNNDPMSFGIVGGAQKSAVGDGNASLNKLVCVDVVKNQLAKNPDFSSSANWGDYMYPSTVSISSGVLTATSNNQYGRVGFGQSYTSILNHKYLFYVKITNASEGTALRCGFRVQNYKSVAVGTNIFILDCVSSQSEVGVYSETNVENQTVSCEFFYFIDLTQRYGNNDVVNAIIGTGTSDEQVANLLAFDPEILSDTDYDAGTLVPSKSAKLQIGGKNLMPNSANVSFGGQTPIGVRLAQGTYTINVPSRTVALTVLVRHVDGTYSYFDIATKTYVTFNALANDVVASIYSSQVFVSDIMLVAGSTPLPFEPYKATPVTLPNYEGHGILKVVDGKVVADGTELYPDGNSKKRYKTYTFTGNEVWSEWASGSYYADCSLGAKNNDNYSIPKAISTIGPVVSIGDIYDHSTAGAYSLYNQRVYLSAELYENRANLVGKTIVYELATEEDITTPVFQSNFPVEQGGTLQFLDENDNPIAGLQGSEIFYQKNIKAFVEAFGEAIDWDPARIERLANLSFTPEYVNITLDPSPTGAYARAQVYNATFTIVISAALTGTPSGSITFQDSEVDLSNFETKPADAIYDMDGKKVSEAPTTADCNIASFVGRSKSGIVLWSLLHSGVNKVKIHIEEAVPLDSSGEGKIDCRASLIL